jgi:single-stranded-DNA-specific exonuclease
VLRRLEIPPCPTDAVLALERELGVSHVLAQVLVRRGLGDPAAARAWLEAADEHPAAALPGVTEAVAVILGHVERGTRITVHGDYDVDGVCATAILVRALRALGAEPDWHLPSRTEDGYGLSAATVDRLAARGTGLLLTADCAVTAVDEVARARAAGMDVVVTDHHQPRASGALPDAPLVHPGLGGYPCPDLCAAAVAHKLALTLHEAAGRGADGAGWAPEGDLDLVALATVADCVPLRGENRRLVRSGLRALAATRKPGLRALMRVAQVDPGAVDARAIGFRLAPRINAAGRLYRADAGLELVLTADPARAEAIAGELDAINAERRHTETRILFEAEAQVREAGDQPAYVLAADGWHPGVIGIVASRIAERRHRPVLMIALDGAQGTGSGRSIPAFDLLGGLDACAEHLLRHGGHRAAAGCTVARDAVERLRAAFAAHAAAVLAPDDLVPVERVDAVVAGDELGLTLAEELERLAPFGTANPEVSLLVPAARLAEPRAMGEGRHLRCTVESGGARARAVAFGVAQLPAGHEGPLDAVFALERNEWGGAVEPRLVLRHAAPPRPASVEVLGEPAEGGYVAAVLAALDAPPPGSRDAGVSAAPSAAARAESGGAGRILRDRRGGGVAGTIAAAVASGEPVLVACADAARRRIHLDGRLGGFAIASWEALERDPALARPFRHVVALDPPAHLPAVRLPGALPGGGTLVLAWGPPEAAFALAAAERDLDVRAPLAALYRALRDGGGPPGGRGPGLEAALRGPGPGPRSPAAAARLLAVLLELGLAELDRAAPAVRLLPATRRDLGDSPAFRAAAERLALARRLLAPEPAVAAAA